MDKKSGREALIFCWFLLAVVSLADRHETRNQFTGRYAGRGVALAGLLLVPFCHEVDIIKLNE